MQKKNIQILIGILFLTVLYVPKDFVVDRVSRQWLLLSAINLVALSYNLFLTFKGKLKPFKITISLKIFSVFFLWALLSTLYTLSVQITVIDISRLLIYLITFYNLLIVFNEAEISFKQISYLFTILFLYEVFFSYQALYLIMSQGTYENYMANDLMGKASNINVASFSIALKVPFLIYLIFKEKSNYLKGIFIVLIILCYVILNYMNTRAITLSNYFILFLILAFSIINFKKKLFLKSTILILVIFFSFNLPSLINTKRSDKSQELISLTTTNDESSNQRIRYYKAGIKQIISNPFLGVGFGNWKLESIKYDKESAIQYMVPYHMHNDFLQAGAELGLIGIFLYFLFFVSSFSKYLIDLKKFKIRSDLKALVTLLFFTYIFVDSNLNFPFARPMVYIQFLIFIAFLDSQIKKI
jgi:O-antigen ligase